MVLTYTPTEAAGEGKQALNHAFTLPGGGFKVPQGSREGLVRVS
jgi:hypothetical protein